MVVVVVLIIAKKTHLVRDRGMLDVGVVAADDNADVFIPDLIATRQSLTSEAKGGQCNETTWARWL